MTQVKDCQRHAQDSHVFHLCSLTQRVHILLYDLLWPLLDFYIWPRGSIKIANMESEPKSHTIYGFLGLNSILAI